MNICGKFGCRNVAPLRCPCKTIYYCSKQCSNDMWPFHKAGCKFSLQDIPLQKRFVLPENCRFVQLYNIVDALDRANRIVPNVDTEATEQELFEPRLQKFIGTSMRIDEVCKSKRSLFFNAAPSNITATRGEDSFKQLVAHGFPPQLVARTMMFGKSLAFCFTICSVAETLSQHAGVSCLHGCEKIQEYFIAKGVVRTLRPRINFTEWKDEPTVDSQAVDNYAILFVPDQRFHFSENVVPGLERAAEIEKQSIQIKAERSEIYKKWHEELQKNSVDKPVEWSEKTGKIFNQIGDKCIFIAPAAGEHDETLYANSYSIGVPSWFQIKQIYTTEELEKSIIQEEISAYSSEKIRQILTDLLGKERMKEIWTKAVQVANAASTSDKKKDTNKIEATETK